MFKFTSNFFSFSAPAKVHAVSNAGLSKTVLQLFKSSQVLVFLLFKHELHCVHSQSSSHACLEHLPQSPGQVLHDSLDWHISSPQKVLFIIVVIFLITTVLSSVSPILFLEFVEITLKVYVPKANELLSK